MSKIPSKSMILKHLFASHFLEARERWFWICMRNASCADIKCDFQNPPVNNIFKAEARGRASASFSTYSWVFDLFKKRGSEKTWMRGRPWTYIDHRCEGNMNPKAKLTVHFRFFREAARIRKANVSFVDVRWIEYLSGIAINAHPHF